jgi:hypothetical protein
LSLNSAWTKTATNWAFETNTTNRENDLESRPEREEHWDWLAYQSWRCCAHAGNRDDLFPIEDIDQFNPDLSRRLNPVDDLFLELDVELSSDSQFGWRCFCGELALEFNLDVPNKQLFFNCFQTIDSNRSHDAIGLKQIDLDLLGEPFSSNDHLIIEMSTFDGQLKLVFNDHVVFEQPLDRSTKAGSSKVLEIGAKRGKVQLNRVRIWRDVFYESSNVSSFAIPANSYLLLGDNVAVSVDSRNWNPPCVPADKILGTVEIPSSE